jgi:hypothetical protein
LSLQAIIRVQFPDNYVLEAAFLPTDQLTLLVDLLQKVILHPDARFYLCKISTFFYGSFAFAPLHMLICKDV